MQLSLPSSVKDISDFTIGLLKGLNLKMDFPDVENCEKSIENLIKNVPHIHDLKSFMEAMNDFFSNSKACFEIKEDFNKFIEHIKFIFSED